MNSYQHISDEQLMLALQKGEEAAFNVLYQRYSQRILYFMYKMLGQDEAKAQDLLQDVFLKVVEQSAKFDSNQSFKAWIFTIAANLCKNYFRSQKSQQKLLEHYNATVVETASINQSEFQKRLAMAIQALPVAYKEAFLLKHKEGLQLKEIAEVMDCPLGTVKSRLSSAMKLLGKQLAPFKKTIFN